MFDTCQFEPPSIENSIGFPALELALIIIVPLACPQSVGFADKTLVIVGATLSVKLIV
jgi:hypothetical protein